MDKNLSIFYKFRDHLSTIYQHYFFDLDGVIWKDGVRIKHSIEALTLLREKNKSIYFISNNCQKNRKFIQQRMKYYGFQIEMEKFYLTSSIIPEYIRAKYPQKNKIYCIGGQGLVDELRNYNFQVIDSQIHNTSSISVENAKVIQIDQDIDAIAVGFNKSFNLYKMNFAINALEMMKNPIIIASHPEEFYFLKKHQSGLVRKMPYVGFIVNCLQLSNQYETHYVGKPNPFCLEQIIRIQNFDKKECVFVGDQLDPDLLVAQNTSIDCILLNTGKNLLEDQLLSNYKYNSNLIQEFTIKNQLWISENLS